MQYRTYYYYKSRVPKNKRVATTSSRKLCTCDLPMKKFLRNFLLVIAGACEHNLQDEVIALLSFEVL
jgi:hypothetical protein